MQIVLIKYNYAPLLSECISLRHSCGFYGVSIRSADDFTTRPTHKVRTPTTRCDTDEAPVTRSVSWAYLFYLTLMRKRQDVGYRSKRLNEAKRCSVHTSCLVYLSLSSFHISRLMKALLPPYIELCLTHKWIDREAFPEESKPYIAVSPCTSDSMWWWRCTLW